MGMDSFIALLPVIVDDRLALLGFRGYLDETELVWIKGQDSSYTLFLHRHYSMHNTCQYQCF